MCVHELKWPLVECLLSAHKLIHTIQVEFSVENISKVIISNSFTMFYCYPELLDEIKTKKPLTQTDIKKLADRNKSGRYIIPSNQAECRGHALEIFLSGGGDSIEINPTELSTDVEKAGLQHRFAQSNAASDYSFVTVKEIVNNIAPTCALLTVWMTTTADTEGTRSHLDSLIGEIMHVIPDFIPVVSPRFP